MGRRLEAEQSYKYAVKVRYRIAFICLEKKTHFWIIGQLSLVSEHLICLSLFSSSQLNLQDEPVLREIKELQDQLGFGDPSF